MQRYSTGSTLREVPVKVTLHLLQNLRAFPEEELKSDPKKTEIFIISRCDNRKQGSEVHAAEMTPEMAAVEKNGLNF